MCTQAMSTDLLLASAHQTSGRAHLEIIRKHMPSDGLLEIRALRRVRDKANREEMMKPVGARFIFGGAAEGEVTNSLRWAEALSKKGVEIFIGYNPRTRRRGRKKDVELLTAC